MLEITALEQAEFTRMMIGVAVIGLLAFGVSGTLLYAFWRSLQKEDDKGELMFTARSGVLLAAVVVSLIVSCLVFVVIAYR
ncbi:MAG: hypothetical protein ABR517_10810 [Thermoanaerobaculia bacterium]